MPVKKLLIICGIALVILVVIDIFFIDSHSHFWWHGFIGFDAIYGILGCVVTILFSKGLGALFIRRKEDYYEGGEGKND